MESKKVDIYKVKVISTVILLFGIGFISGSFIENKFTKKVVHVDLDIASNEISADWEYPFMPKEYSDYICKLSKELKIDSDLAVAILMRENPEFNSEAEHKNKNGTCDKGLFQLNDYYCYSTFIAAYWDIPVEFNIFNWKHNTFIALHLIEDLTRSMKIQDEAIMAYNCGIGSVMRNDIPSSTRSYLAAVKNNLRLIKADKTNANKN